MNTHSITHIHHTVKHIWCETLGMPIEQETENFFSLGGSSMQAFEIINRVNAAFKLELTIIDFFDTLTIEKLAHRISETNSLQ